MDGDGNLQGEAALWNKIHRLGAGLGGDSIESSFKLFTPLHQADDDPDVSVTRDVFYGPHGRNRLDVYQPAGARGRRLPVLLFVHGGGFTAGDKRNGPFFGNVGNWAARNGMIGVAMTYRLAPEFCWPCGEEDIRDAIGWCRREVASYGGDPDYIVLMGHSAGAGLGAGYLAHRSLHPSSGPGLRGAVLISGLYDLTTAADLGRNSVGVYYGEDVRQHLERSATPTIKTVSTPIAVMVAENEPHRLHAQAFELVSALFERDGKMPRFAKIHSHNHYSEILSFGLPVSAELQQNVRDFVVFDCAEVS